MQAHGFRRTRLQCMVTRTRALHARVTTFSSRLAENFPQPLIRTTRRTTRCTTRRTTPPGAQPARKVGSTAARQLMAVARWSLRYATHRLRASGSGLAPSAL
jgi:hypothetical protein